MKALLLAAGVGSRLRPLTDHLPKCLAPVRGVPLLAIWLHRLVEAGVTDILVNTHHHASMVREFILQSPWRDRVLIAHEPELLGTGGTVLANADWCACGPFILAHADNLSLFEVEAFVATHAARPASAEITMMTFDTTTPESCGIVELGRDGTVCAFHEKVANPPGRRANAAVYVFEPSLLGLLRSFGRPFVDISTEILPQRLGRMVTFHNDWYHRDIGTIQSLGEAQTDFPAGMENTPFGLGWLEALSAAQPPLRGLLAGLGAMPLR